MNTPTNTAAAQQAEQPTFELDFDSDAPLPVCPMRKDGMAPGEICESCQ